MDNELIKKMKDRILDISNPDSDYTHEDFEKELNKVLEHSERVKVEAEKLGEKCPECGKDLVIKGSGDSMQASFTYEKKIYLAGPASLLIVYRGSNASVPEGKPPN